jgi:4-hydroxybenzoate polyprenyltransferase
VGLYRIFHFLSLDIVLGATGISFFASRLLEASPGWAWYVCLGMTVWLLYMGDHLLDAWRYRDKQLRELHHFIFGHRRSLLWIMALLILADSLLVFHFLNKDVLEVALALGGTVLLFYVMRHGLHRNRVLFIPGELFVLLVYLAGTWMGPYVARTADMDPVRWLLLLMLALVLMMNLGIISLYDAPLDSRMGIASLANLLGRKVTKNLMLVTAGAVVILAVLLFLVYGSLPESRYGLILLGMALILLVILLYPSWFMKEETYRKSADAVLFLSYLALLI